MQITTDGRTFDITSPEEIAWQKKQIGAYQKKVFGDIDAESALNKSKALISLKDSNADVNRGISEARQSAAREGGGSRGMSRRTYKQKGGSAFSSIGKLASANAASRIADVSSYFDQSAANEKRKVGPINAFSGFKKLY